jgi:hypothetical protein
MSRLEIVGLEVSPNVEPLLRELTQCGIRNGYVLLQTITRLTEPPASLEIPAWSLTEAANALLKEIVGFDCDAAARMFRLDQRQHNSDAKWKDLSRAERKRARRLWTWAIESSLDTAPQGRPNKIDPALVLYCAYVIAEGCGKPHLRFSRPTLGGAPCGPMWRALMTALPLAYSFLDLGRRAEDVHAFSARAEAVVDILKTGRSKEFKAYCRDSGIVMTSDCIAMHPSAFRLGFAHAREYLTKKELAKLCRCSERTIDRLLEQGDGPASYARITSSLHLSRGTRAAMARGSNDGKKGCCHMKKEHPRHDGITAGANDGNDEPQTVTSSSPILQQTEIGTVEEADEYSIDQSHLDGGADDDLQKVFGGRPSEDYYWRTHPDKDNEWKLSWTIEFEGETYLVHPKIAEVKRASERKIRPQLLVRCVNVKGREQIWHIGRRPVPPITDGPKWTQRTFQQLRDLAFSERRIDTLEHEVWRKLASGR